MKTDILYKLKVINLILTAIIMVLVLLGSVISAFLLVTAVNSFTDSPPSIEEPYYPQTPEGY